MAPKRRKQTRRHLCNAQPAAPQGVVRTEGPEDKSITSTDKPSQGLKFVDVTPRYLQGTRNYEERKSIRVHVMQDFLRQKRLPVDAIEPPAMAGTVSSHVHRFRIAKPRLREDKHAEPVSAQEAAICSEQDCRSSASSSPQTASMTGFLGRHESAMANSSSRDQPNRSETLFAKEKASVSFPRIMPNLPGVVARMDPFARLPIDGSVQTHEILDYYRTSYWSNSLAVNPDGKWFSVAAMDSALFHAQLSIVIQHQALSRGTPFPESYYHHRGMAISIVTSRLVHPVEAISDSTIGAVALLANSDVSSVSLHSKPRFSSTVGGHELNSFLMNAHLQNYFDVLPEVPPGVQNSHMKGLLSLIQLRGGLHTLSTNEPVKRVVTWADLVHATSNDTVPCLGISKCNAGYDLQLLFPDSASAGSPLRTMYPEQAPVPAPLKETFETIRLLSIAQSSPDTVDLKSTINRRILANVLYRIEYLLLDPLLLSLEASEGGEGSSQSNYFDFWTPLFSATTAGVLIFTYSCLRNLAIPSRPYERLVTRLRRNLQLVFDEEKWCRASGELSYPSSHQTRDSPSSVDVHPSLLLWLLLHGFKATVRVQRRKDREWFVRRGAEVCQNLKIDSVDGLDMHIKQVVTFGFQCGPVILEFWKAICAAEDFGEESQ